MRRARRAAGRREPFAVKAATRTGLLLLVVAAALAAGRLTDSPARGAAGNSRWFGSTRAPAGQVLRYNNGAEPETIDPALAVGQPDGRIARMMWEGLTNSDPKTLEPVPGMAERWEIGEAGRTYTFHLRKAEWSDGHPVTAADFVYAWRRVLDPRTAARYAGLLYYLKNAARYNKGQMTDPDSVGVHAVDDSTLAVTLEYPTPYWLGLTSFYSYMPVPRWCIERWGDRWTRPGHAVVNGPFQLTDWRPNNKFVLDRNPRYWDAASVRLDRVVAYSLDDLNTGLNLYKSGMTDWSPSGYLPTIFLPYLRDDADFRTGPNFGIYYYSFNVTDPVMKNRWLRKALAWSVDREALCRDVLKGSRMPRGNMTPLGYRDYHAPPGIGFDPGYARECLARAGYPGGKGLPKLSLLFNTSEDNKKIAEVLQSMWKEYLGIDVELSNQEWGSYLKAVTQLDYQIARRSWIADYADPNTFLATMVTGDGNNRTGWSNVAYDRLLDEANRALDPQKRFDMLSRAEAILLDEAPVLPLYNLMLTELIKPYVRGIETNALDEHPMKYVWIDHDWQQRAAAPAPANAGSR